MRLARGPRNLDSEIEGRVRMERLRSRPATCGRRRLLEVLIWTLLGMLALGGCGSVSASTAARTPTAAQTPTSTATPTPTATSTPAADACGVSSSVTTVGGLTISPQAQVGDLSYPTAQLPNGAAQQPLVIAVGAGQPKYRPNPAQPTNPLVMTDIGGGYVISIRNSAAASHAVRRMSVCLDSLTPSTSQLNEWQPCAGSYSRGHSAGIGGGCGGVTMQNEYMHAPFTANPTVGTVVTASRVAAPSDFYSTDDGPLPVTLHPGQTMTIEIGLGPINTCPPSSATGFPTGGCLFHTPGTYVFAFGLAVDDAAPVFAALSPPTLLAPAKEWTGEACTTSAMQALIPPATNPPTYYICPE